MIGSVKTFAYPSQFITLPDYTAHAGQRVTVIRKLEPPEVDDDPEMERMYEVRAADGWVGQAFESELID